MANDVSAEPLQSAQCELGGRGHPPADFLGGELQLGAVRCEVVGSGHHSPVRRALGDVKWCITVELVTSRLDSGCAN